MKKNLMLSGFTLLCTLFLLICIITAWYVTNKEASATGITGSTDGDSYSLKLQRGTYSESANPKWTWQDTESLSFTNISPGNKFFFRIVIDAEKDKAYNFTAAFDDVKSSLIPDKLAVNGNYVASVEANNKFYNLYPIVNNAVIIKPDDKEERILYQIVDGNIILADYKLEDAFLFYPIGTLEPANTTLAMEGLGLNNLKFDINVTATENEVYYYFALEFNETNSEETIDGLTNSNCFMYQKLSIGHIQITYNE